MISFLPYFHFTFVGRCADTLQSCYTKQRGWVHIWRNKKKETKNMTRHKSGSLTFFCIYSRRCCGCTECFRIRFQSVLWVRRSSMVWGVTFIYRLVLRFIYTRTFFIISLFCTFDASSPFVCFSFFLLSYNKYIFMIHMHPYISSTCSLLLTICEINVE